MPESRSNWKILPSEISHYILQLVTKKDLCNCALVCKGWLPPTQTLLYSKVSIKHFEQLEQFQQTVEQDSRLGSMVKKLYVGCIFMDKKDKNVLKMKGFSLLTTLLSTCLPNLEILQDSAAISYIPVLDALMNSQLRSLRRLQMPSYFEKNYELIAYISCALLMKDRLENLYMSDFFDTAPGVTGQQIFFDRLCSKIGQFNNLTELIIQRETNEGILLLDTIVESCPTLQKIWFNTKLVNNDILLNNCDVSIDAIPQFIPRTNVKTIISRLNEDLSEKFLLYLMHKFPSLDQVFLGQIDSVPRKLNQKVLEPFLHYLSRMTDFVVVDLDVDHDTIIESFSNFWKATSAPGSEAVEFCYSDVVMEEKLILKKEYTTIGYPSPNPGWKHVDFLKENGIFLKKVSITTTICDISESCILFVDDITQLFTHCPLVRHLWLEDCNMEPSDTLSCEKRTLDELSFLRCKIFDGSLESLSVLLTRVKNLQVFDTHCASSKESTMLSMPFTTIDQITFGVFEGSTRYMKVSCTMDENIFYYVLRYDETLALPSTEEEYLGAHRYHRAEVRCASNPIVKAKLIVD